MDWLLHPRRTARREWRKIKRWYSPGHLLAQLFFDEPSLGHVVRKIRRPTRKARIRRDPTTGRLKTKGVRLGEHGWEVAPRRKRAKRKRGERIVRW
jgi:hypothetical protein